MYGTFTYKCPKCNVEEERFIKKQYKFEQTCEKCNSKMIIRPSAPPFFFKK